MPASVLAWKRRLVKKITCPNCWHEFPPEDIHYIARSLGDPVLGPNEYLRFSPTRFTVSGAALDPAGHATVDLACPRCHLQVPELLLEVPSLIISLIGSPASGKSYFLTTMTYLLRSLLPQADLKFTDACPESNSVIREYEDTLFSSAAPAEPVQIRKTDPDDPRLYKFATISGISIRFPMPLQFSIWPTDTHPNYDQAQRIGRVLVLYDNAGEDFLPGAAEPSSAVIRHLARCDILFTLLDPSQEGRLKRLCDEHDPQIAYGLRPQGGPAGVPRQEVILTTAANHARRYLGVTHSEPLDKPLIVIIPKADLVARRIGIDLDHEPYAPAEDGQSLRLRCTEVERTSAVLREFLRKECPDFVATAESLSRMVCYIPVSSLGCSPVMVERGSTKFYGIRPADLAPKWVTVPLMYCLTKWGKNILACGMARI
ncbi:MAG: hypothetical protein IMZ66_13015 [Planctomycetes bacterium]|nr:hypothetical protein [Planctomycetota bacterium]